MTSIPLRTVRPFVMDEIVLTDVAEEEGFDVTDQIEITKYLKLRVSHTVLHFVRIWLHLIQVSELINKANDMWDRRNAQAVEEGEAELPRLHPLVRLKVDALPISLR
jgi:double-strand break repair protein MRE11